MPKEAIYHTPKFKGQIISRIHLILPNAYKLRGAMASTTKGQLISKCLFEKIVWTKLPTKNLIDSAHYTCWAESIKFSLVFWSKRFFQKDILKLTDLYAKIDLRPSFGEIFF